MVSATAFAAGDYLRVDRGRADGVACLQVAVRTFEIENGPRIRLVGVAHIGSEGYYRGLQEVLSAADVVLFEGVDGDSAAFRAATKEVEPERSALQANLARALGLEFQLHVIDYSPEHFVNSDVSSRQLTALFEGGEMPEEREEAKAEMERMLAHMEQTSASGRAGAAVLAFLEERPGWSRGMRWAMVNVLGSVTGDLAGYAGLPERMQTVMKVLIDRRNDVVMADIREQVERLPPEATLAVFYGAAHMHDFHSRLLEEFRAREVEVEWRNAFCGDLRTSGLNLVEKRMVRWFVFQQVRTLQRMAAGSDDPE